MEKEGSREEGGQRPGRRRREALSRAGGGVTPGQCPPVPSSGFKIAVVSFVQHEKKPQDQLLEKWVEEANEKKKEVEKEITSASQAQILFLKGPQEGLPALTLSMAWRGHGQILAPGLTQPKPGLLNRTAKHFSARKGLGTNILRCLLGYFLLFWFVFLMLGLYFLLQG